MTVIVSQSRINFTNTAAGNAPNFREFVGVLTGMFSGSGWVDTNASGSINPTTVTGSESANAIAGYQVWRFNDNLHNNGYPVYIKTEYGTGANLQYTTVWITVSFYHDGSGSVAPTGVLGVGSTPRISIGNFFPNGSYFTHRMCCISGSDLSAILCENYSNSAAFFLVERTKDVNGNPTTEGVWAAGLESTNFVYREYFMKYGLASGSQTPAAETYPRYLLAAKSAVYNNRFTVGFFIPMLSGSHGYASRMFGLINQSSLTEDATHQISLYNTQSVYYVSPNTTANNYIWRSRSASEGGTYRYIMRHE